MGQTPLYVNLPLFILGLYIIVKGSDLFLDNAVWIARASGVPQIVIGATLVSICTTLPELVSSTTASIKGAVDMAVGNAVGSIICNTGFILGMMLLFIVARANRQVFFIKGAFMLGSILGAFLLVLPGEGSPGVFRLERANGVLLLTFFAVYLMVNVYESQQEFSTSQGEREEPAPPKAPAQQWRRHWSLFFIGAVMVGCGAYLLVEFGQRMARDLGVKEAVISLVFIAFGTSLPELATAVSAVRKKAEQISVGNIFGANVMNILLVIGSSSTIRPMTLDDNYLAMFDLPVAFCLCSIAFCSGLFGGRMGRRTGIVLIALYVAYLASMVILGRIGVPSVP